MKLSDTLAFNCIALSVKFGQTSCEDIPPAVHRYSKLYYLYHLASLFKFCRQPPHPHTPPASPSYIHWPNINEFHAKIIRTGEHQPLSTCQVSCTKANR